MESGLWLIIVTALSGKVAYHCFRYKNVYWAVPTISGFKTRKEPIDSKGTYRLFGISAALWTVIIFGYTCFYFWQMVSKN